MVEMDLKFIKTSNRSSFLSIKFDTFLIISDDKGLYFLKTCQNMDFFLNEKLMYVALDKQNTYFNISCLS
jgi:hypothetical protein